MASDPLVLGAGGTTLAASHATGAWISETAWGLPRKPGTRAVLPGVRRRVQPSLRPALLPGRCPWHRRYPRRPRCGRRRQPDTGLAVVISNGGGGTRSSGHGGTSASAPIWAGLIALADQYAGRHLGFVNPAIYQIARSPHYHQAFHDITTGKQHRAVPAHDDHRLPAGTRLGPGHRLGQPRRPGAHPPARPLRQPLTPDPGDRCQLCSSPPQNARRARQVRFTCGRRAGQTTT